MLIERYTGIYGSSNPALAERQFRHFLRSVTLIPLNQRVIHAAASLRAELRARNLPISHRAFDLVAAATARTYNLTLITSNTRHFQDIPGLRLLDPRLRQ
jgi:tRNA(fMet)-specific endonuclease VapC